MKPLHWTMIGSLVGAVIGYPLSYYFQHPMLRNKVPLGKYISHISDVLGEEDFRGTAIGTWIVALIVCTAIGFAIGVSRKPKPAVVAEATVPEEAKSL